MTAATPALTWLSPGQPFPPVHAAWGPDTPAPGLLAAGGDLSPERLLAAYRRGIFPWFGPDEPILWWFTAPRMVLKTADFRLSHSLRKSMRALLRSQRLRISFDAAFDAVIHACASTPRAGQQGTWITPAMREAYAALHRLGAAHSVEVWWDGELAGGLYGLQIGRMVYGESMFTWRSNASKMALTALVARCAAEGLPWIDCQQVTAHLQSLGARPLPADEFLRGLEGLVEQPGPPWRFDPAHLQRLLEPHPSTASP